MKQSNLSMTIGRGLRTTVLLAAVAAQASVSSTSASVVVPMTLSELATSAVLIVDGTVSEVRTVQGPHGIERVATVRVAATWKGTADDAVHVRLAGGRLGRIETHVAGVPAVTPGDRVVWFLARHPHGGYVVLGLHQGALRVGADPDGRPVVVAPTRVPTARGDVRRRPRSLADVAAEVRDALDGGAQ